MKIDPDDKDFRKAVLAAIEEEYGDVGELLRKAAYPRSVDPSQPPDKNAPSPVHDYRRGARRGR